MYVSIHSSIQICIDTKQTINNVILSISSLVLPTRDMGCLLCENPTPTGCSKNTMLALRTQVNGLRTNMILLKISVSLSFPALCSLNWFNFFGVRIGRHGPNSVNNPELYIYISDHNIIVIMSALRENHHNIESIIVKTCDVVISWIKCMVDRKQHDH